VIIVMLNSRAAPGVRQWFDAVAAEGYGERIHLVGVLALDVAFFIPRSVVAGTVRGDVPREYWSHAWIDAHGHVVKELGLDADSAEPYAITTDADGRVTSIYRGAPTSAALDQVGRSLGLSGPPPNHKQ
jgi:hypothetical protein